MIFHILKLHLKMDQKARGIIPKKIKGLRDIDPNLNQLKRKIIEYTSKIYR